jgi:hypothetical protein
MRRRFVTLDVFTGRRDADLREVLPFDCSEEADFASMAAGPPDSTHYSGSPPE